MTNEREFDEAFEEIEAAFDSLSDQMVAYRVAGRVAYRALAMALGREGAIDMHLLEKTIQKFLENVEREPLVRNELKEFLDVLREPWPPVPSKRLS